MAAYVVTPTGEMFEYPTAAYATRKENGRTELYTSQEKTTWVADVPATFMVGWTRPRVLGASPADMAKLKRALRNFDSRTNSWKD